MPVFQAVVGGVGARAGLNGQQVDVDGRLHLVAVDVAGIAFVYRKDQSLARGQYHLLHGRTGIGRVGQGVFAGLHRAGRNLDAGGASGVDLEDFVRRRAGGCEGVCIPKARIDRVHAAHRCGELHGTRIDMAGQDAHCAGDEAESRAVFKAVRKKEAGPSGGGVANRSVFVVELDEVLGRARGVGLHRPSGVAGGEGLECAPVEVAAVGAVAGDHPDRPGAVGAVAVERVEVAPQAPAEGAGVVIKVALQRVPGHQIGLVAFEAGAGVQRGRNFSGADDAVVDPHIVDAALPEVAAPFLHVILSVNVADAQRGAGERSFHRAGADFDAIDVDRAGGAGACDGVLVPLAVYGEGVVNLPAVAQAQIPVSAALCQADKKVVGAGALRQDDVLPIGHVAGDLRPDRHGEVAAHGQAGVHGVDVVVHAVKVGVVQGAHIGRLQLHRDFAQVVVAGVAGAELQGAQHRLVGRCAGVTAEGHHTGAGVVAGCDAVGCGGG